MKNILVSVTSYQGITFNVVVIRRGERYGRDDCKVHDEDDPLIEFYDARYTKGFTPMGQFVSRYYLSSLLNSRTVSRGIDLCGYEPTWKIDAEPYMTVVEALEKLRPPMKRLSFYTGPTIVKEIAAKMREAGFTVVIEGTERVYVDVSEDQDKIGVLAALVKKHGTSFGLDWN